MLFITLNPNDPDELDRLMKSTALLVRYHSPNCNHCKEMEDEWKALKDHPKLKDKEIAVVDVDSSMSGSITHKSARLPETQGVPTIVFIKGKKSKEHKGARKADAMAEFAISEMSQGGGRRKKRKYGTRKRKAHQTRRRAKSRKAVKPRRKRGGAKTRRKDRFTEKPTMRLYNQNGTRYLRRTDKKMTNKQGREILYNYKDVINKRGYFRASTIKPRSRSSPRRSSSKKSSRK